MKNSLEGMKVWRYAPSQPAVGQLHIWLLHIAGVWSNNGLQDSPAQWARNASSFNFTLPRLNAELQGTLPKWDATFTNNLDE